MYVRDANVGDLDAIVGFIAEEAREAEGRMQDVDTLKRGVSAAFTDNTIARYWVLADELGLPCGCASVVKEWSDWNAGFYWWIQSMYISPEHRGKGNLDMLIDCIAKAARKADCLELRLYVHDGNATAIRAYEKAGFHGAPYMIMSRPA